MENEENLKKLQQKLLLIMEDIDRVCRENGICYYLCGGTLLGALRHNGFIPWDDDLDIYMKYEDFLKFEQVANKSLKSSFFYQTPNTDMECKSFGCGRVRFEGTHFKSNSLPNNWIHNGIFIDVLPLIKVPRNKLIQKIYFYKFQVLSRIVWLKNGYTPHPNNKLFRLMMWGSYYFTYFIPSVFFEKKLSVYHEKYKNLEQYDYIDLLSGSFSGCIHNCNWYDSRTEHCFEDKKFYIPKDPEAILESYYGNWKELPPIEERVPHHIDGIEF